MDDLIQLAMQIIFCLLIAAILGAIIGYLLGKMSKCDKDDYDLDLQDKKRELNDYENRQTLNSYDNDTVSSGIDKTKGMAAAGVAGAGAVGAGLYNSTKDIGSNIGDSIGDRFDKTKSIVNDAKDSVQNFGSDAKDYVVNDSEKVTREIADDYTVGQEIGVRPSSIDKPTNSEIDDLKEVSGIGLKIEEVLNSLGIYHFKQISEWSPENIEWIENYLSIKRRVKKEDWIGQATLLASGGFTDFSKKVQRGENRNYD